jgi:hypothetical protein
MHAQAHHGLIDAVCVFVQNEQGKGGEEEEEEG